MSSNRNSNGNRTSPAPATSGSTRHSDKPKTKLGFLDRSRHLAALLPFVLPYRRRIVAGSLMVLLTNAAAVLGPWILGEAIDQLNRDVRYDLVVVFAVLIVAASVVEGIFRYLMRRILIGVSRYIEYDIRNVLYAHLQKLSGSFYQSRPTGDIMARATNDLNAVRMVLGPAVMYSMNTVFTSILTISILLSINWRLTLLTLLPLVGVSVCVQFFGKRIHQRFERIQEQFSHLTTVVQENLAGVRVVKAYGQERASIERFERDNEEYYRRSLDQARLTASFHPILIFLLGLSFVGLLWLGGRQVMSGEIALGRFVAFMAYLAMLTWPTVALGWVINIFERGSASMGRINALMDTRPDVFDHKPEPIQSIQGHLRVRGLDFAYNGSAVLKGIDFEVQAGETVAIVGNTGSGKSTLADLLCHLHPIPPGTIFYDGHDINRIPLATLRSSIGYVPQDTFLFSETVRGNIAFADPSASEDRVVQAAEVSQVRADIEGFPAQFDTFVGERGVTLSGGQKQRVAISRALLADPPILILDDALSAVDTETEERILRHLGRELKRRTAVLISHRLSTIRHADLILVLEDGRIVERGTHDELLEGAGRYARLWEQQLIEQELESR